MDTGKGKEPESAIDELVKGMQDLQLKFTKLEKGESSSVRQKPNEGNGVNSSADAYGAIAWSNKKGIVKVIRKRKKETLSSIKLGESTHRRLNNL